MDASRVVKTSMEMFFGHNWGEGGDIYRLMESRVHFPSSLYCCLFLGLSGWLRLLGLFHGSVLYGGKLFLNGVRNQMVLGFGLDLLLLLDPLKAMGTASECTGHVAEEGEVKELPVIERLLRLVVLDWSSCLWDGGLISHLAGLLVDHWLRNLKVSQ